jgi:hypothetical protein
VQSSHPINDRIAYPVTCTVINVTGTRQGAWVPR